MGDSACWLAQTCNNCGRVLDDNRDRVLTCPYCGGPTAEPDPSKDSGRVDGNDPRDPAFRQLIDRD